LLHDIQFSASVRNTKLGFQRIPRILAIIKSHIGVNKVVTKNVDQSPHKYAVDFLKSFLLSRRKISLRSAESGAIVA
jgi:hypothetical protein